MVLSAQTPAYVNKAANHIDMNGADWSGLANALKLAKAGNDTVVRVLHIGDSHIQAEFVTNRLRALLQQQYGNAGRGLMVPLRLAGTNQSHDYAVTSPGTRFVQARLLKLPWPAVPGVTGIAAQPDADAGLVWRATLPGHKIAKATLLTSEGVADVSPAQPSDSIVTPVKAGTTVYGLIAENGRPGVLYSAIGNNGATYNDYLLIPGFARQTKVFNPNLIVLSMGTNEAFSTMDDNEIRRSVHQLVGQLRAVHPRAQFLMLLPMECQKNRNHGYRPLSPDYDILERNAQISALLKTVAKEEGIPSWDFYAIAGGEGCSAKWIADKLMNRDRIHLLKDGYELQAALMAEALAEQLDK